MNTLFCVDILMYITFQSLVRVPICIQMMPVILYLVSVA